MQRSAWATDESGDWQSLHAASAVSVAAVTAAAAMIESTAAAGVCMQHAEAEAEVQPVAAVQVAAALPSSLPQPAAGRATKAAFGAAGLLHLRRCCCQLGLANGSYLSLAGLANQCIPTVNHIALDLYTRKSVN